MARTLVTNGTFDTAAGLVEGPYGPLTRVDSVADHDFNSDIPILCTSNVSTTELYISYDQMTGDETLLNEILANAHGGTGLNHLAWEATLMTKLMFYLTESYAGPPYADLEWQAIIQGFRFFRSLAAQLPIVAWDDYEADQVVKIPTFTPADHATVNFGQLTLAVTGEWTSGLIDWGAGATPTQLITPATDLSSPLSHDYGATGAQTVEVIILGAGGIVRKSGALTVV